MGAGGGDGVGVEGEFEPGTTTLEHFVRMNVDCCVVVRVS